EASMSQLLVVHGGDGRNVRDVADEAIAAFAELCGVAASDRVDAGCTSVALFPALHGSVKASTIARSPEGRWGALAGVFFPGDAASALVSSDRIASHLSSVDGMFVAA